MTQSPHDALFRYTFSQPEHAASLIKSNLPAAVVQRIDWSSLQLQPGSFVSDKLAWRHSDLIFRARIDDRDALLYVLIEHQSNPDPLMPWRVLSYVARLCDSVLAKEPKRKSLPAVIPIVLHHGKTPWNTARDLHDIIDLDDSLKQQLAPYLPQLRFVLDDLSQQSDAELRGRALTNLALLTAWSLENLPHSKAPIADFKRILDVFAAVALAPRGHDALTAVLHYFMEVSEPEPDEIRKALQERVSQPTVERLMSTAEKLRAQGRAEGEAKGKAEGKLEGRAEIVLKLLTLKFGQLPAAALKRVQKASIADLDLYAERVLSAKTLAQVWKPAKKR